MELTQFFRSIAEPLQQSSSVQNIFGEPVAAGGKTIIPVARIAYGFGGGGGQSSLGREGKPIGEGGGGGGGMIGLPVGVVEISSTGTRLIRFDDKRKIAAAIAVGFAFGFLFARRPRK